MSDVRPEPNIPADTIEDSIDAIETIERLVPIQFGILFGCLKDESRTVYLGQWRGTLEGDLDPRVLEQAWRAVVARHAILRTAFDWQMKAEPVQVVLRAVETGIAVVDLSSVEAGALREARIAEFLAADRARGFDLAQPPLMRLALLRLSAHRHVLVWTRHHLTCDGWSLAELFGELFTLYGALRRSCGPSLPRPVPFSAYVRWWHEADHAAALRFWRARLADLPDPTTRDAGAPALFATVTRVLTADRLSALRAFCRSQRITLNTLVQGAWALVLARQGAGDRVVFGATEAIRPDDDDLAGLCIGPQIATLPVVIETESPWSTTPWLQAVQAAAAAGRRHGRISLSDIAAGAGTASGQPASGRSVGGRALFDSVLVFQNYPLEGASLPPDIGLALSDIADVSIPDLPLTLIVEPGVELLCRLIHDSAILAGAAAGRLLASLETALLALAATPDAPIRSIDVAPWLQPSPLPAPKPPVAGCETVLHRIAAAPEAAIALVQGDRTVTYGALRRQAQGVAEALRQRVGAGARVGLLCRNSIESIVGLLGILWSGGAYVPLDPDMPAARLRGMVADAGLAALLVDPAAEVPDGVLPGGMLVLSLAERVADAGNLPFPLPDALAYVIFTSGSTGRPKGVAVGHRSLLGIVDARPAIFPEPVGGALLTFPLVFDGSVLLLFATLARGGRLVLPDAGPVMDAVSLCRTIARCGVTHTVMVPSLHAALLDAAVPGQLDGLVACAVAGEACSPDLVRRHRAALPAAALVNEYGPTEATVWATAHRCPPGKHDGETETETETGSGTSIGVAIPGVAVYLLDAHLRPVPPGVPGEMVIGGRGVAWGYLGNPGLTAERFLPDPWSGAAGARMYRTGDRAVAGPDGRLRFLGRADQQIKLRGYRIEPAEIETVLGADPGVAEAVVLLRDGAGGERRLVAYVIGRAAAPPPDPVALGLALGARLPAYMVPTVMVLAGLPRLPSGKVDRAALPDPAEDAGAATGPAPLPGEQAALAEIWQEVLRRPVIATTADFFDLGGTSLLGMRLVAQIRTRLGAPIELYDLFRHPTIGGLAPTIARARDAARAGAGSGADAIPRRNRARMPVPASTTGGG
ncbi:MAG: amino acid adenylation domain-containing protein [Proteobacteria bacterium]|nr:amino acid adenylation domain-containing protein [Pseudomonadota bacterium]